jgi:hypothetical protein
MLRNSKPTDQENVYKARDLIYALVDLNPQIETNIWVSALMSLSVDTYKENEISFTNFKRDMAQMINHYEKTWDE